MLIEVKSGDVLVCVNNRNDLFSKIKRWAMGPYEHVESYIGNGLYGIPLLVESDNRGVVLQNIAHQDGRRVMVMRPIRNVRRKDLVSQAVIIASDSKSDYDWTGGLKLAAFRVLREKFGIKRPLLRVYERDKKMICSEAIAELFWRSDIPVLPDNVVPIPADFAVDSDWLNYVGEGNMTLVTDNDESLDLYIEDGQGNE